MLLAPSVSCLFKRRQFEPEVVLLAVGWYLRFSLSYRDVEELLAERGVHADHVTVWRWVQRYAPEMERRLRSTRPKWVLPAPTKTGELTLILAQGTGWPAVGCSDWLDDHRIDCLSHHSPLKQKSYCHFLYSICHISAPVSYESKSNFMAYLLSHVPAALFKASRL